MERRAWHGADCGGPRFAMLRWLGLMAAALVILSHEAFAAKKFNVVVQSTSVVQKAWSPSTVYYQYVVVLENTSTQTMAVDLRAWEYKANHPSGRADRVLVYRNIVLKGGETQRMTLFYYSPTNSFNCDIIKETPVTPGK